MAIKDWAEVDPLTPDAMNELVSSGFMRFPDTAARDAFLTGDLAPVPGMTVSMLDTNLTLTYLDVGGITGWYPSPQTLCFAAYQTATQSLALSTYVTITGWTVVHGRNLNNWFDPATGRFQPTFPGLYEFSGGLSMAGAAATTAVHRAGFRLNGAPGTAMIAASEHRQITTTNVPTSFAVRRYTAAMNGTTDVMEVVAYASAATTTGTGSQAPSFSATYLGQ